jgi:hypothetical protein
MAFKARVLVDDFLLLRYGDIVFNQVEGFTLFSLEYVPKIHTMLAGWRIQSLVPCMLEVMSQLMG